MPWNIWPALVVLWGVCWMFYSPLNANGNNVDQFQFTLEEEQALFSISGKVHLNIDISD